MSERFGADGWREPETSGGNSWRAKFVNRSSGACNRKLRFVMPALAFIVTGTLPDWPARTVVEPRLSSMKSPTTTEKLLVALNGGTPSSVTMTVTKLLLDACPRLGVQKKTPLFVLIRAPRGPPGANWK